MSATSALILRAFWRFRNTRRILREQSPFKVLFIVCFALAFELGIFALFLDGFRFLNQMGGAGRMLLNQLFALFFLGMGAMLTISSIVTGYATIFRSTEMPFLLTRPFSLSHIVVYKFLQSTTFASWSFGFIVIPFVAAYATFLKLTPWFVVWTFLFSVPFLVLCAGIGAILVLAVVRWSPSGRLLHIIVGAIIVTAGILAWSMWRSAYTPDTDVQFTISRLIPGIRPASHRMSPSWWMAGGVLALARGEWIRGGLLWSVLASSALMLTMLVEWLGSATYMESWRRVMGSQRRSRRTEVLFAGLERRMRCFPADIRGVLMKDLRTFLRDATQWGQALVFFGLLTLYFANLRNFRYHTLPETWRNTITFLNVFSVSAVICSLGSRFIYPQLSLEGQGFWVLGLSPVSMTRVLLAKFVAAVMALLPVSIALMLLSGQMLNASVPVRILTILLATCIGTAVCGLSTGLGAIFLDLKSTNPSAIVSSFGGTLNLVLSLGFMLLTIVPFGLLFHVRITGMLGAEGLTRGAALAVVWVLILTVITTWVPLKLGNRALHNQDF